jgi:hypothetical protein
MDETGLKGGTLVAESDTSESLGTKRWPKVLAWVLIGIATIIILVVIFFTPLNNAMRSATGNDTPADTVVKNELVKRIDASKTGDPATDAKINAAVKKLKKTKMTTIMKAADNQQQLSKLLNSDTSLSQSQAKAATKIIFKSGQYTDLRQAVAKGKWVAAYKAYKQLSGSGALTYLKNSVNN